MSFTSFFLSVCSQVYAHTKHQEISFKLSMTAKHMLVLSEMNNDGNLYFLLYNFEIQITLFKLKFKNKLFGRKKGY